MQKRECSIADGWICIMKPVRWGNKVSGKTVFGILLLVMLAGYTIWHLPYGMHLDELLFLNYGVSATKGMHLITENYSPYQLCEIIQYPFVKLFRLLRGDFTGIALYMRYVYTGIQIVLAVYIYCSLRKKSGHLAMMLALLHYLYRYHWPTINYKALLYWGTLILAISLYNYHRTDQKRFVIIAAIGLIISVFGNPFAVMLYVAAVVSLIGLKGRKARIPIILMTGICMAAAVVLILSLGFSNGWDHFCSCLPYLFDDGTSTHRLMSSHRLIRLIFPIMGIAVAENGLAFGLDRLAARRGKKIPWDHVLFWFYFVLLLAICFARIRSAGPSRFWYILLSIFLLSPFFYSRSEMAVSDKREIFWLTTCPSCFMIVAVIMSTNQGIAIVAYACILGLFGIFMLYEGREDKGGVGVGVCRLILGMMLFMFLLFVPEDGSANILQHRTLIEEGPLRGIYVTGELEERNKQICSAVSRQTRETDRLLIIGDARESLIGLMYTTGGFGDKPGGFDWDREAVASGRQLLLYEMSPAYIPTVVIVDDQYLDRNPWVLDTGIWRYVEDHYAQTGIDGKYRIMR